MTFVIVTVVTACSGNAKEKKGDLGGLKTKLEKLKKEKASMDADIRKLEEQIAEADRLAGLGSETIGGT